MSLPRLHDECGLRGRLGVFHAGMLRDARSGANRPPCNEILCSDVRHTVAVPGLVKAAPDVEEGSCPTAIQNHCIPLCGVLVEPIAALNAPWI